MDPSELTGRLPAGLGDAAPAALACALVAWAGSRRALAGLVAGLLALLAQTAMPGAAEPAGPPGGPRLLELVVPGLHGPGPGGGPGLVATALLGPGAVGGSLDVGLCALLLALLGLAAAPGWLAWGLRVVAASGVVGLCLRAPWDLGSAAHLLQLALATLAGLGLATVGRREQRDGVLLFVGGLAVVLAGGLALLAAWSGAAEPRELMQPFTERLTAQGQPVPPAPVRDVAAARLVSQLDRAALAAFAAMTAVLIHLKTRRGWSALLVAAVALGDLLWR